MVSLLEFLRQRALLRNLILVAAGISALSIIVAACGGSSEAVFRIGAVHPLTGDAASYGVPTQKTIERAVSDLNEELSGQDMRLEVIFQDGKCNQEDARDAARKLVEEDDVVVIYGGSCSDETLGMAPYTESKQVLLLTSLSSSDAISDAGDYVFRNYPSNYGQVDAMVDFLRSKDYRKFALLTADTAYAQDLRRSYLRQLSDIGGEIVADEVVADDAGSLQVEASRIAAASPDVVVVLPQTVPGWGRFVTALDEAGVDAQGVGNDVSAEGIAQYGEITQGYLFPTGLFEAKGDPDFVELQRQVGCENGLYCAGTYDGIFLLAEVFEHCGDRDTTCMRDYLYNIQNWEGRYYGTISFDDKGDIGGGSFRIDQVEGDTAVPAS